MEYKGFDTRSSRRRLLAGCAVLLSAAAVAACSAPVAPPATQAPTQGSQPSGTTSAPQATAPPSTGNAVEIRVHDWAQDPKDEFYGPMFKKLEQEHPNIKIKKEFIPRDDLHTKQLALAATSQIGDVVRINVAVLTPELVNKNVLRSLSPLIKSDKNWYENDHKQFWPGNLKNYEIKGEQWGYPVVGHPGAVQYYTNVDMLTKAGAKLPGADGKWTIEQAIEVFKAGTRSEGGRITVYGILPNLGGEGTVGVLRAFGGDYYNEEGTKALVGTKESIDGLSYLADLFQKYKVAIPLDAKPDAQQVFPGEKVAVVVSTSGLAGAFGKLVGNKFKWLIYPPPIGPSGKFETQVSSDGIGIAQVSKHPDLAWEVIKLYGSKEFGVKRHLAGLGSPGSRYDVWTDPEFKKARPELAGLIYDTLINPEKAPPLRPWNHPANGRYFESDTTINNILQDVWLGNKKPADAAAEAQKAAQAILDKPPV